MNLGWFGVNHIDTQDENQNLVRKYFFPIEWIYMVYYIYKQSVDWTIRHIFHIKKSKFHLYIHFHIQTKSSDMSKYIKEYFTKYKH